MSAPLPVKNRAVAGQNRLETGPETDKSWSRNGQELFNKPTRTGKNRPGVGQEPAKIRSRTSQKLVKNRSVNGQKLARC